AVRLPDAELLRPTEVAGRFAETEPLQGDMAPFREQPVGALPVHDSPLAALRLRGDGDLRDDPFRHLHDKGARWIRMTHRVGLAAGVETGTAEKPLPLPDDAEPVRQTVEFQRALPGRRPLVNLVAFPHAGFRACLWVRVDPQDQPLLAER